MAYTVDVTHRHQPGVMNSLADNAGGKDEALPSQVNIRSFSKQREQHLEIGCFRLGSGRRQSEAVDRSGPGGDIAKFDQVLRCQVEHFPAAVQLDYSSVGDRVGRIGAVRQPNQDAGIDKESHYS